MILSFIAGTVMMFLSGMELQRILVQRDQTPAYVYATFSIFLLLGLFNLTACLGYVVGKTA